MFQSFESSASPAQGPARLAALRKVMGEAAVQGFIVPRADLFQGEYVAPSDSRLEWLTGFTGSAGLCLALMDKAGVFIDGRYRTQVKSQVDLDHFTPVPWPETKPADWLRSHLNEGIIGFDPWLHTADDIAKMEAALEGSAIRLQPCANLIDAIWQDRPAPPAEPIFAHPIEFAGESAQQKRERLARSLREAGARVAVLTQPDSICWLLNIRGSDVPRNPVAQMLALLCDDGSVALFTRRSADTDLRAILDDEVTLHDLDSFDAALRALEGTVQIDRSLAPLAVSQILREAGIEVVWGDDPCRLPKAVKNNVEIAQTRKAHLRDGVAMAEFLAWLDRNAPGDLTETKVVSVLEDFRRASNALYDISFDTICGAGPDGAIIHYRVTHETDRKLQANELLLVDSGAQYKDGTTDITRTIAIGDPGEEARICYTAVLRGVIAISRARWPRGLAGRDLDPLARQFLWSMGFDFDHGTGHGVGAFLSVHEGPQRISRVSEVPLQPGMILSNEPGYYREGAFGIRLENLIVVQEAEKLGDNRDQLSFETLTFTPFDRRLIKTEVLSADERAWIDAYHAEVLAKIGPRLAGDTLDWLSAACAPL